MSVSGQTGSTGCWAINKRNGYAPPGPWARMIDNIASKLAFFPPTPASYSVKEHKDHSNQLYIQPADR